MDHAALVGRGEARADLPRDLRGFVRRKPADAADHRSEIFSIDILHCQEKSSVGVPDVKHAADVGMRDLPRGAHFRVKPRERSGILGERLGKKFQCDDLAEG